MRVSLRSPSSTTGTPAARAAAAAAFLGLPLVTRETGFGLLESTLRQVA